MTYLDQWAVLESDHVDVLSGAIEDLEASTLRLPVTGGAKVCLVFEFVDLIPGRRHRNH